MDDRWKIWITEGTDFLDCIALSPGHKECRLKLMVDRKTSVIEIADEKGETRSNQQFEIISPEDPVCMAIRLITETPLNAVLPESDVFMAPGETFFSNPVLQKGKSILITTHNCFKLPPEKPGNIFDQNVKHTFSRFDTVVEVEESIGSNGSVSLPLTEGHINTILKMVFTLKPDIIGIMLKNSCINALHENVLCNLLKTAGYKNIFKSECLYR